MLQSIHFSRFAQYLFDTQDLARKAGVILQAILAAQSPRLSEIAEKMPGKSDANYKQLQRFLAQVDLPAALRRLFQTDAPFVIGDPTEMPRPQAYRTPYVGLLKDGKTRGFWLLMLATPFRGRALPFGYITYSSKTIATEESSRTFQHYRAFETLKDLVGDKPLVLDREFSYLELLEALVVEQVHFVIRLKLGSQPPHLYDHSQCGPGRNRDPAPTLVQRTRAGERDRDLAEGVQRTAVGDDRPESRARLGYLLSAHEDRREFP
jgi:hypothetical protein